MSEDVFCKLKDLHHDVRVRIEATADWKALQAVERAMSEVQALLPVAAVEAVPADIMAEPAADAAAEAAPEAEAAADAPAEAEAETAQEEGAEAACEAAETSAADSEAAAPAADQVTDAAGVEAAPEAEAVAVPEIPAEHKALVEEIVSTGAAAATAGGTATA